MTNDDANQFRELIQAALSISTQDPVVLHRAALKLWWTSLNHYPINVIEKAVGIHLRASKYRIAPADIVEIINSLDGRPEPDVAWSTAIKAADEFETVLWTDETAAAWTTAQKVYSSGDKIGARKTFLADYEKRVRDNRLNNVPVNWQISAGFDSKSRDMVTRQAQERNLLPNNSGSQYLLTQTTNEGKAIAGLIGFDKASGPDETVVINAPEAGRLRDALKKACAMTQAEAVDLMKRSGVDLGDIPTESLAEQKARKREEEKARRIELERQVELLLAQAKERYQA